MTDPDDRLWKDPAGYYAYLESPPAVAMLRYVAHELQRLACKSVLDVGCWKGIFARVLDDVGRETRAGGWSTPKRSTHRYTGFDYSRKAIEYANEYNAHGDEFWPFFYRDDWKDPIRHDLRPHDGVYFGGVTSYHNDPAAWVDDIMLQANARVAVVQDIQRVDLSGLDAYFSILAMREVYHLGLPIDDEERQNRQIWTVAR